MERPDPREKQIYIKLHLGNDDSHMTFNLPCAIDCDVPQSQWKKIISTILDTKKERWFMEEDFAPLLEKWLDYLTDDAKDGWDRASRMYQNYYCDPSRGNGKKELISIRAHNKRMMEEVKRCKTRYEKCVKRKELFKELRDTKG